MDIEQKLRKKAKEEADRIFDMVSKNRATVHVGGKEMIGVSRESLRSLTFNAMVDGAKVFSDTLKGV